MQVLKQFYFLHQRPLLLLSNFDLVRSHLYQDDLDIESFGYAMPARFPSSALSAMLCIDERWGRCDIKSTSLLGNVLAMNKAKSLGCQEVVMHKDLSNIEMVAYSSRIC